jgi:hypothetical protein
MTPEIELPHPSFLRSSSFGRAARSRRRRSLVAVVSLAGMTGLAGGLASVAAASAHAGAALAQPAASRLADVAPRLERTNFSAALTDAELARGERDLLMALFEDYRSGLQEIASDLEARRIEAGRDRFDDAIAGRIRLSPDEIKALRGDIARADLMTWAPATAALSDLLELCGLSLEPGAAARFEAEVPALRRAAFLGSLAAADAGRLEAGESVDLQQLLSAAVREELNGAPIGQLETVLAAWAAAIDPILPVTAGEIRAARIQRGIARSLRDPQAVAAADAELIAAWRRLHGPLEAASRRIEEIARGTGGDGAAAAWRDRVQRASFPWLYEGARRPELAADWMGRNVSDAGLVARGRELAATWRVDRAACDAETVALMVEARTQEDRIVHPRADLGLLGGGRAAEIFRELLRISGRAEQIDREAEEAIAALLTPTERSRMRADVRAMSFRR